VNFGKTSRSAVISGIGQYDTGQRLRMHGLPSPQEFAEKDDLLSGEVVTVQVHYAYRGDQQAGMRLALWDEEKGVWMVDVPNEYTRITETVYVMVYVYYGNDGDNERATTMYRSAFTPISRPAPNNVATEAQKEEWAKLCVEIDIVLEEINASVDALINTTESVNAATASTNESANAAKQAAQNAREAQEKMEAAGFAFAGKKIEVIDLPAGSEAMAEMKGDTITLGVPRGSNGAKGERGETGPSDVTFEFDSETGTLTMTTV